MMTVPYAPATIPFVGEMSGMRLERYIRTRWDREQGGIRALTDQAGVSSDALYKWFRGESEPSLEALGRLARVLSVRRYELVAIYDGDQPAVDLGAVLDPTLRVQLVDLIVSEIDRRLSDEDAAAETEAQQWARSFGSESRHPAPHRLPQSER